MNDVQQPPRTAVCENLRLRVLHHMYGPKVKEFDTVPASLIAELYPFDYDFLTTYVEKLLQGVGDFDMDEAHHHAFRNRHFLRMMHGMVEPGSWYDTLDLAAEGLLAYRFDGYNRVSSWARGLEGQFPNAVSQHLTNRLAKAITILTCATELDESYFTGEYARVNRYARDPEEIFTKIIDWFVEFLGAYAHLSKIGS